MESSINPFDSQETKPYQNDPEIIAMTNLVAAYQRKEIKEFEKILKGKIELIGGFMGVDSHATILSDPFIKVHIDSVLKNIRNQGTFSYYAISRS